MKTWSEANTLASETMVDIGVKEMKGIFFFFYNNNSVRASKIKSDNFSLFCSRRILDVSIGTKEKVNINRFDLKSLIQY